MRFNQAFRQVITSQGFEIWLIILLKEIIPIWGEGDVVIDICLNRFYSTHRKEAPPIVATSDTRVMPPSSLMMPMTIAWDVIVVIANLCGRTVGRSHIKIILKKYCSFRRPIYI